MPAHITIVYPFLREDRLNDEVLARLRALCASVPALTVQFRRTARFPGVLYIDPEPADAFRELTGAVVGRWPDTPPYGGGFDEVIPHLTVARGAGARLLDDIEADVQLRLPITTTVVQACLYVFDGQYWRPRARLPFRSPP
jgi:2'-5' RNA ligase